MKLCGPQQRISARDVLRGAHRVAVLRVLGAVWTSAVPRLFFTPVLMPGFLHDWFSGCGISFGGLWWCIIK